MSASSRCSRLALLALVVASPLMVAEDCGPVPPADDPVLVGHPDVVARLEARHGPAITLLRDYYERSEDDVTRFRIRDDSVAFDELSALQAALPRLERVVAVEYSQDGSPVDPFCGEGGEITRFELDLITRGLFGKPVPHVVAFELCRVDDDGADMVWSDVGELEVRDEAWVGRVLRRAEAEALRLVNAYEADRQVERIAILGRLLGCPAGTRYERSSSAHYCVSGEVKHGPYVEGELTDTLVGARQVMGAYLSGQKHGDWLQFDAEGRLLSTTEWQHGARVGWGGGF
jgi:hypothetical protein